MLVTGIFAGGLTRLLGSGLTSCLHLTHLSVTGNGYPTTLRLMGATGKGGRKPVAFASVDPD